MAQLSDSIEKFILTMMDEDMQIDLRRNELAQHFGCAPSQINYVLATRFSVDHGYLIESQRGGGGYVRIVRIRRTADGGLLNYLLERVGNSVSEEDAMGVIRQLISSGIVTDNEARLIRAAVGKNALALPVSAKDVLRAAVLREMLIQVFRSYEEAKQNAGNV